MLCVQKYTGKVIRVLTITWFALGSNRLSALESLWLVVWDKARSATFTYAYF